MAMFKDGEGREWHVNVDNAALERFDRTSDLGVFEAIATDRRSQLFQYHHLFALLFECVRSEAEERHVGFTDFKALLGSGQMVADATNALVDALQEYFPAPKEEVAEDGDERPTSPGNGGTSTP